MKVSFHCKRPTNVIVLNVNGPVPVNNTLKLNIDDSNSTPLDIKGWNIDKRVQFLYIHLKSNLTVSKNYSLEMNYTGILNNVKNQIIDGFYRSSYVNSNNETRYHINFHSVFQIYIIFHLFSMNYLKIVLNEIVVIYPMFHSLYVSFRLSRYLATTHFEPDRAREAFPSFDEPDFKATFTVHLIRKPGYIGLSNMPKKSTTSM